MNIETRDEDVSRTPRTNFSVVRVKRDILRRSTIGAMVTNRSESTVVPGASNLAYGADAGVLLLPERTTSAATTRVPTPTASTRDDDSYQGRFDYDGDRYGLQTQYLKVGDNFNPGSRLRPARQHAALVRAGAVQSAAEGALQGHPAVHLRSQPRVHRERRRPARDADSDRSLRRSSARTATPSRWTDGGLRTAAPAVRGVARRHHSSRAATRSTTSSSRTRLGLQRRVSGRISLQVGEFYDGTIIALGATRRARVDR